MSSPERNRGSQSGEHADDFLSRAAVSSLRWAVEGPGVAIATTDDFCSYERHGLVINRRCPGRCTRHPTDEERMIALSVQHLLDAKSARNA